MLRDDPLLRQVWQQLGSPSGCCVTGGYVRDRLLGRPSSDLDLTIGGDVDEAKRQAKQLALALSFRAHLIGTAPHQVWRIETPALKVELWPLGGLSREEDIRRRDFSCNALSWELPDGPLVDLVGGFDDLHHRRLRAISRANLEDDPVRLLRAPRFLAQLPDFALDDRTRSWIEELAPSLARAPRERVGRELLTLLRGPRASRGLAECLELGLFVHAAPDSCSVDSRWLRTHLETADTLGNRGPAGVPAARSRSGTGGDSARLAFLFRGWGIPGDGVIAPYAWPKTIRENALRAASLLDEARAAVDGPPADRRELAWRAGSAFPPLIALAAAVEPQHSGWRRWRRQWSRDPAALEQPQALLTGTEVAEFIGVEPGPGLGGIVRGLLRAQIRGEVRTRGGAVKWLGDLP